MKRRSKWSVEKFKQRRTLFEINQNDFCLFLERYNILCDSREAESIVYEFIYFIFVFIFFNTISSSLRWKLAPKYYDEDEIIGSNWIWFSSDGSVFSIPHYYNYYSKNPFLLLYFSIQFCEKLKWFFGIYP